MKKNTKQKIIIYSIVGFLIISSLSYFFGTRRVFNSNCNLPDLKNNSQKTVTKVIDGDTFVIQGGYSVRMLGIETDEIGEKCYKQAKEKLKKLILGKQVRLEKGYKDKDDNCRYLRYVFLNNKNIGLEMVESGLAIARFDPNNNKYRKEITQAENKAINKSVGCQWSNISSSKENEFVNLKDGAKSEKNNNLKTINPCQAKDYIGKKVVVQGRIAGIYKEVKDNIVFLNLGHPYPNSCLSGVIFDDYSYKFVKHPESYYIDETVQIRGKIEKYKDKLEIILKNPDQIKIIHK